MNSEIELLHRIEALENRTEMLHEKCLALRRSQTNIYNLFSHMAQMYHFSSPYYREKWDYYVDIFSPFKDEIDWDTDADGTP